MKGCCRRVAVGIKGRCVEPGAVSLAREHQGLTPP